MIDLPPLRALMITTPLSTPKNWKHESSILLPLKLARYLARERLAHVHFLLSDAGEADFIEVDPLMTVHRAPGMYPPSILAGIGCPPDTRSIIGLIRDVGPDLIIVFNGLMASLVGAVLESDGMRRKRLVDVPLVLWDGTPIGYDIVERGTQSSGQLAAAGYLVSDYIWCSSESHAKAVRSETTRNFGFAAARNLEKKLSILPIAIDKAYMDQVVPAQVDKRPVFTIHVGGRWSATKGYPVVADAVFRLQGSGAPIAMLSTGMSKRSDPFRKAVAEINMEVVSGLTQEAMWGVVRSCHLGVLAQDAQALPAMPFEQMALGLPVLVRSTERTRDVLPQYPLVWSSPKELLGLISDVMENPALGDQGRAWFEEHWREYDISLVRPEIFRICDNLGGATVPIRFDEAGVINVAPRGTRTVFFMQSLFCRTLARREAHRLGTYREEIEKPLPAFVSLTEDALPKDDEPDSEAQEDE